jgi:hypothetical protein
VPGLHPDGLGWGGHVEVGNDTFHPPDRPTPGGAESWEWCGMCGLGDTGTRPRTIRASDCLDLAVSSRNASQRITTPLASALTANTTSSGGHLRTAPGMKTLDIHGRPHPHRLDLPLAHALPAGPLNASTGQANEPRGSLHRRQPAQPGRVQLGRQISHRVGRKTDSSSRALSN